MLIKDKETTLKYSQLINISIKVNPLTPLNIIDYGNG